jgi:quercetin dioxygenase-like cupin family protein
MTGNVHPRGDIKMTDTASVLLQPSSAIPADDPKRKLTVADPHDSKVRHVAVVGDTYSILVSGAQTAGRYCLIDMIVPNGSGPPPHRHDFEKMFTLLEGELQFTFRGETTTVRAGSSMNIPANAPRVQECFRRHGAHAVHVHAGGAGRILHAGRRSIGKSHIAAAQARQSWNRRADEEGQDARTEISH